VRVVPLFMEGKRAWQLSRKRPRKCSIVSSFSQVMSTCLVSSWSVIVWLTFQKKKIILFICFVFLFSLNLFYRQKWNCHFV
jgi:hypothetical protein